MNYKIIYLVVDIDAGHLKLQDPDSSRGSVFSANILRGIREEVGNHGLARLTRTNDGNLDFVHFVVSDDKECV